MSEKKKNPGNTVPDKTVNQAPEKAAAEIAAAEKAAAEKAEAEKAEAKKAGKKKDPMITRAMEVFGSHDESVTEVFFTSDGTAFIKQQYAFMHAASLKDEKIVTIKRSEV